MISDTTRQILARRAAQQGQTVDAYVQQLLARDDGQVTIPARAMHEVPVGITIADATLPDLPLVYVNKGFQAMTGYHAHDILGSNCRFLQNDDRDQDAIQQIGAALAQGDDCRVTLRNYRKDGTLFWNALSLTHITNEAGVVTHIMGVQRDITEQMVAQEQLRQREADLRRLFVANPLPMMVYAQETLAILDVNDSTIEKYGYSREEFLAMTIEDIRPSDQLSRLHEQMQQQRQTLKTNTQALHQRRDGSLFRVEITSHIMDYNGEAAVLVVANDVTERHEAQQQLAESEKRYRMISGLSYDYAFAMRVEVDGSLTREWMTDAFKQVTGFTPEESAARGGWQTLVHPDDLDGLYPTLRMLLEDGYALPINYRIIRKDGIVRHIRSSFRTERDPQTGQVARIYAIAHDMTERVQLVQQLTASNAMLAKVTALQQRFIAQTDTRKVYSDLLATLLDLTDSEYGFIGEVQHDDDGQPYLISHALTDISWDAETQAYYEEHMPEGFIFDNMNTLFGYTITHEAPLIANTPAEHEASGGLPSGHPPLDAYMGLPIIKNDTLVGMAGVANRPGGYDKHMIHAIQPYLTTMAGIISAHRNERQRQAMEDDLRQSEMRFRQILEAASEGILLVQMSGKIVLTNQEASNITGYLRGELHERCIDEVLPVTLEDLQPEGIYSTRHIRQVSADVDLVAHRARGSTYPVAIRLSYIEDAGEILALCFFEDITERKQLEAQRLHNQTLRIELEKERELMQLKRRFISMISHEFRTPLTIMLNSSQILQRYRDRLSPERFEKHLNAFQPQIMHMTKMLNNVLLMDKVDAGLLQFNPRTVDVRQTLGDLVDKARLVDHDAHPIRLTITDEVPDDITADPALLEHIVLNLLSNAAKYSERNQGIHISLTCDDDALTIAVEDNGVGIPAADQKRLFMPFHRAQNVQTIQGTGLGLTIVQRSVELHGGTITCESELGEGTVFTVQLPLGEVPLRNDTDPDDHRLPTRS